jgi:hypothetical protein
MQAKRLVHLLISIQWPSERYAALCVCPVLRVRRYELQEVAYRLVLTFEALRSNKIKSPFSVLQPPFVLLTVALCAVTCGTTARSRNK